jgi:hypothetical protein
MVVRLREVTPLNAPMPILVSQHAAQGYAAPTAEYCGLSVIDA